eukprot:365251-Chlamydomonas_euryale.AAC.3
MGGLGEHECRAVGMEQRGEVGGLFASPSADSCRPAAHSEAPVSAGSRGGAAQKAGRTASAPRSEGKGGGKRR